MTNLQQSATHFADTKPHYALLDGLRGVAALLVVWYHVFEGYQFASGSAIIQEINHGYLAVDFFFILSGFVIGYAYDNRWGKTLTLGKFFKRRLIRLHPMVVMGALIGLVMFILQGAVTWNGTPASVPAMLIALLCAMLMIPALPGGGYEVRGNGEMFPLNGPAWSLFFEYIGNILYALFIRRLSTRALAILAGILSILLLWFTATDVCGYGMFGVGWTLDGLNFWGGLLRMLCPFTIGMLLSRVFHRIQFKVKGAFWISSIILLLLFHVPYIESTVGGSSVGSADGITLNGIMVNGIMLNGVFEAVCIILIFPAIVWLGASGTTTDRFSTRVCTFLGDISFPLYIVHYPFMYYFYSWLIEKQLFTLGETWPEALITCAVSIVAAWLCLKFYDLPVRRWLAKK